MPGLSDEEQAALVQLPFVAALSPSRRRGLLDHVHIRRLKRRDTLMHQGDAGDALFLVRDGLLKVYTLTMDGREKVLRLLGPGDIVGEMALVDGAPRSTTVVALQNSTLLRLPRGPFIEALLAEHERAQRAKEALKAQERQSEQVRLDLQVTRQRADRAERERKKPVYRRSWFWGVLGGAVVAVGASVGIALGTTLNQDPPTDRGIVNGRF